MKGGAQRIVARIVSGGQSGVDRAALDAARAEGIDCGGWCPKGRRAEDGRVPERYPLRETPSGASRQRTLWNVRDSDGTLVIAVDPPRGGTALALCFAGELGRPSRVADPREPGEGARIREWIALHRLGTLNVAGARESESPGIYAAAHRFLREVLEAPTDETGGDAERGAG